MSSLSYMIIYNSDLTLGNDQPPSPRPSSAEDGPPPDRDEDAEEAAHIVFYSASNHITTRDKMLRHLGLAKGLENFAGIFAPSSPSTVVTSTKSSLVTICPEPGYRIHVNVTLPSSSSTSTSARTSSHDIQIPASLIEAALHRSYASFVLLNGRLGQTLDSEGRKSLDRKAERFWNVWTADWQAELESGRALSVESLLGETAPALPPPSSSSSPSILLSRSTAHHVSHPSSFPPTLIRHLLSLLPQSESTSRHPKPDSGDATPPTSGSSSEHTWLTLPSLGMGNLSWGGKPSPTGSSTPISKTPPPSRLRTGSVPISAVKGKTVERKSSSRWYTGTGLMDFLTPASSSSTSPDSPKPSPPESAAAPSAVESTEPSSVPVASKTVDAGALSDAIDTQLPEPEPPAEEDEQTLAKAWEDKWRTLEVWLPERSNGEEAADLVKKEIRWIILPPASSPTPLFTSAPTIPSLPTLYAYFPSPPSTIPSHALILSLLTEPAPPLPSSTDSSPPTPATLLYTPSGAHPNDAWSARARSASKKSAGAAAAGQRSLVRSVGSVNRDPEVLESIARTSLSPAKWIVAKRNPADAESGLMMVLDGKSVGLGDVDTRLRAVEKAALPSHHQ